uniref:Uncharacterized protein n=1 Tax=Salix viminalis TaxID=40686 RepID=A0A6N2LRD9_SALVM
MPAQQNGLQLLDSRVEEEAHEEVEEEAPKDETEIQLNVTSSCALYLDMDYQGRSYQELFFVSDLAMGIIDDG